ncbi:enoyl-ACP reductase FabI [Bilophila wadsworthia]|uniref:enoyl-ACP reductase FabI n=1 Tax=Bilophila wadsworthia TaxID=35833 RepID=UPI00242C1B5F|nr:enoyl-ACP reductase [Bilophila wadsworthia]
MLLKDKKCLIFGVANNRSIAYGIASCFKEQGARLAFSYAGEAIHKRVEPISEELGDEDIAAAAALVKEKWGSVDVLVHSVAFANREDLTKRFIETSRDGFATALNVSAYSLTALCHAFEPMLNPGASVLTMTYYGAQKIITNYNVMGVAKAALEASVRYLSVDLGAKDVRINAISAGPLKTLASSGISDFKQIFNHIEEHAPLRRNVTTEDVGKAAVFLASDLGSAVTGEIMFVDCGYNNLGI